MGRVYDQPTDSELARWWETELAQKTPEWLKEPPFCRGCRQGELEGVMRHGPVPTDIQ